MWPLPQLFSPPCLTFPFYLKLLDPIPSFFLHSPLSLIRLSSTLPLNVLSSDHNQYKTTTETPVLYFSTKILMLGRVQLFQYISISFFPLSSLYRGSE